MEAHLPIHPILQTKELVYALLSTIRFRFGKFMRRKRKIFAFPCAARTPPEAIIKGEDFALPRCASV
jgi:hypothetical protein